MPITEDTPQVTDLDALSVHYFHMLELINLNSKMWYLITIAPMLMLLLLLLQMPINPYGKAKKMAEDIILDLSKQKPDLAIMILRLVLNFIKYLGVL